MNTYFPRLMHAIGLSELATASDDLLQAHIIPAAADAFSENDMLTPVSEPLAGTSAALFGQDYYARGILAQRHWQTGLTAQATYTRSKAMSPSK